MLVAISFVALEAADNTACMLNPISVQAEESWDGKTALIGSVWCAEYLLALASASQS